MSANPFAQPKRCTNTLAFRMDTFYSLGYAMSLYEGFPLPGDTSCGPVPDREPIGAQHLEKALEAYSASEGHELYLGAFPAVMLRKMSRVKLATTFPTQT